MENIIGIKTVDVDSLEIGEKCLCGPFLFEEDFVQLLYQKFNSSGKQFKQERVYFVKPETNQCLNMMLVKRVG